MAEERRFTRAVARRPGDDLAGGLTTAGLGPPELPLARAQHRAYVEALRAAGLEVELLDPLPGHPDCCFIEDAAVIVPGAAVITRPGAPSRRAEAAALAPVLARLLPCVWIEPPGTLDGGDVLDLGGHFLIGLSGRTNRDGAGQLARILADRGCTATLVPVGEGLHLKSSLGDLGGGALLVSPALAGAEELRGYELVVADPDEAYACNFLLLNGRVLLPEGFPRTAELLQQRGLPLVPLQMSELRKLDGGLSCL